MFDYKIPRISRFQYNIFITIIISKDLNYSKMNIHLVVFPQKVLREKNKMGIFGELSDNVTEIGVMAVTIVLISLLLGNFKTSSFICNNDFVYNATSNTCCVSGSNCVGVNTTAINTVGTGIDTAITGVGTPVTYITIIVLVVVFSAILVLLVKKLRDRM